jgi:dipeptidase E
MEGWPMRLYLSSDKLGESAGMLLAMLGNATGARAAIIGNGFDGASDVARETYRAEVFDPAHALGALGIAAEDLDLRAYHGDPSALRRRLSAFDLVWVMGGNAFVLRRAMKASRFDAVIADLLKEDNLIYAVNGAGAVVAGPTLRGFEVVDDPFEVPDGYDEYLVWSGLGLTRFTIVPHFRSNHPESAGAERLVNYLRARRLPYRALSDGEVVVAAGATGASRGLLKRIA